MILKHFDRELLEQDLPTIEVKNDLKKDKQARKDEEDDLKFAMAREPSDDNDTNSTVDGDSTTNDDGSQQRSISEAAEIPRLSQMTTGNIKTSDNELDPRPLKRPRVQGRGLLSQS